MQSDWFFYPKYGTDIVDKVVGCFVNEYLSWEENGYYWSMDKMPNHDGWFHLSASPDGNTDYYTETCFMDDPISGKDLTENMLIRSLIPKLISFQERPKGRRIQMQPVDLL